MADRAIYVDLLRAWLPPALDRLEAQDEAWRKSLRDPNHWGPQTPGHPITLVFVEAFLADEDDDEALGRRAADRMAAYRRYSKEVPAELLPAREEYANGMPPQTSYFILPYFCEALEILQRRGWVSAEENAEIQSQIADSIAPMFTFPEWGSHNRTMLRAWTLAQGARVCPGREERTRWLQMADQLAADSVRGWTVEDAMLYHGLWSHALIGYVDARDMQRDFFREPTARFYFEYYLQLLCPLGGLADFGDSHWASHTQHFATILERGAREYGDGRYRWAASELVGRLRAAAEGPTFGDPSLWIHCARDIDESVAVEKPESGSREVLEELAGKKVVFRSGWDRESTYLLLNYKPETDYGRAIRDYMRSTIVVNAEKAHHGHSDENAISTLTARGALLLHDGGYREELPNGKYRADYYHARPVVRRALLRPGEGVHDFLHDDGHHRQMVTERIDFRAFDGVEFSRTRAMSPRDDYEHDRIIVHLTKTGIFLVVDAIHVLATGPVSVCNLFFTHHVTAEGDGWYDTHLGPMQYYEPDEVAKRQRLLIVQPPQHGHWGGHEPVRRYYTDEIMLHQSTGGRASAGDRLIFYSALVPHAVEEDPAALAKRVRIAPCSRSPRAAAMQVVDGDETTTIGVKLDLEDEILFEDVRPRYDWDSGRTVYGDYETDARFLWTRERDGQVDFAWTEATRLLRGEQALFDAPEGTHGLQYVGPELRRGTAKWRAWQDRAPIG